MDNDGDTSNGDNSWVLDPRLPTVIPVVRSPGSVPVLWRLALPYWRLALVAALAAGVGIGTAMLWPFQNRLAAVVHPVPSVHAAASPAGDGAASVPLPSTPVHSTPVPSTAVPSPPVPSSPLRMTANSLSAGAASDACRGPFPAPQVIASGTPTVLPADAVALLGLTVEGAPDGAQLIICGFAARSVFSAGRSIDETTWVLPVSDVTDLTLIPPRGFVGPMKLVVALVNTDKSLADRRTLMLQWLPLTPGVPAVPRVAEINTELEEGKRLRTAGNLTAARAIFMRYAAAGDSRAAFLLAETYDPIALAKHQLLPPDSDPEKARLWYRRASERGSSEANARLDRLSNW